MSTEAIRQQIEQTIADDERAGTAMQMLLQVARNNGKSAGPGDLQPTLNLIYHYLRFVPTLLDQAAASARQAGIAGSVQPLLNQVEQYWYTTEDVFPDRLGVIGLTDDAYYILMMIEALSAKHQRSTGHALIDIDLREPNGFMRQIIGDPVVSLIEQAVNTAVNQPSFGDLIRQLGAFSGSLSVPPHPIWGNASTDDIVKTQMGMMGIF